MVIFFQEIVLMIIIWLLRTISTLSELFNSLLGIQSIHYQNNEIDLLKYFLSDSKINNIFSSIFIITIFLCAIFIIISIIKNAINNKYNVSLIIGKYIISLISSLIVLILFLVIFIISNSLLNLIINIFNINLDNNIANLIFNYSVNNWFSGYSINEIDLYTINTKELLGEYINESYLIFPKQWKYNGMINPDTFSYIPCLITTSLILYSYIHCFIKIVKRIYNIVLLYIIIPIPISIYPLDDGIRFKQWKEQFIKEIIVIFTIILSFNIFIIFIPLITRLNLNNSISIYGKNVFKLFLLSGGALFISSSISLINKIFTSPNINKLKTVLVRR